LHVSAHQYARLSGVHTRESPHGHSRTQRQHLLRQESYNTVKLELPSISSVHARGPVDTWYNAHYAPKPAVSSERLPALPQIQSHPSGSSTSSSPRGDSISSASVGNGSASSNTSYATSVNGHTAGFKTPSPEQSVPPLSRDGHSLHAQSQQGSPYGNQDSYGYPQGTYSSMNQMQSYADVHPPHMSAATAHAPASAAPSTLSSHYSYPPQSSMMQPSQHQYGPSAPGYPPYGYSNGVPSQLPASSSMNNAMVPSTLQLPGMFEPPELLNFAHNNSYGCQWPNSGAPWLSELPATFIRPHRPGCTAWNEASCDCHIMGRRGQFMFPGRGQGRLRCAS
jgi:protein SOK2